MLFAAVMMVAMCALGRETWNFNQGWLVGIRAPKAGQSAVTVGDPIGASAVKFDDSKWLRVTLPHAWNEDDAFRVLIDSLPTAVVWYRKHFTLPEQVKEQKVFLEVEGVRQAGEFYVNGIQVGLHENGITAFGLDITTHVHPGENVIAVRTDNAWDYRERSTNSKYQWNDHNFNANYGGMPKNVWLHTTGKVYQTLPLYTNLRTTGTYIYAHDFDIPGHAATIHAESEVKNESKSRVQAIYRVTLIDRDGRTLKQWQSEPAVIQAGRTNVLSAEARCTDLHFWSWGYGYLYDVRTELLINGEVADAVTTRTGFRKTAFGEGKIWLNDRVIMMHGYAQRTSNEWPALGMSVPAWLSDYSNALQVESGGNLVRWMHTCPWKQDVESCDRVGLIQAMPAGDAEKDREGKQWVHRTEAMRDAIIYNRNNPSILFYESGNRGVSEQHMRDMLAIRDKYDPFGGRAIGSREMLDIDIAEYGGEMLYINKSKKHPMWMMEYCRDEGLRLYWDEQSWPYHPEGAGPLHRGKPAPEYNRNQDQFAVELVRRWYDYWLERPGRGKRVNGGGAKIVFSDTNTHCRGEENYRRSGVTDAMRIPKDGFFAHQVMWDGWVTPERERTYIIGHWNYADTVVKDVYVVSSGDSVALLLNGKKLNNECTNDYRFLYTFKQVAYEAGTLEAVSYKAGVEVSRYAVVTAGKPAQIRLTPITNPAGFKADGADVALIEVEVVDKQGRRCPLDHSLIHFTLKGEGEWRGGIAKVLPEHNRAEDNFILSKDLPVECGVNRVLIRSTEQAGTITLTAETKGLKKQTITLHTQPTDAKGGLSTYIPSQLLSGDLRRGETPATPSYQDELITVDITGATSPMGDTALVKTYDDNEYSMWQNDGKLETAEITYTLAHPAAIKEIAMKVSGWKNRSYPLEVYAGEQLVWKGWTVPSLGYAHLVIDAPQKADTYRIRMFAQARKIDDSNKIGELAGGKANKLENGKAGKGTLGIIEIDFMEDAAAGGPTTYVQPAAKTVEQIRAAKADAKKAQAKKGTGRWPNGADVALSLTFDDGLLEHYTVVFPLLKELGLRGTFWIIGSSIDRQKARREAAPMTWEQVREMAEDGQEIANHSYSHRNLAEMTLAEARADILRGDSAVFAHTGKHTTALAFPSNHKSDSLIAMVNEMGIYPRVAQQSFGGKSVSTEEAFTKWINKAVKRGGWTVGMTHAISIGYDAFPDPAVFEQHLRTLAQMHQEGKIYIAPFSEIAAEMAK